MREIPLTRGYVAIVDDEDYEWLMQFKWRAQVNTPKYGKIGVYAITTIAKEFEGWLWARHETMHRMIMGIPRDKHIDHISGNGLDNRRCNLRLCTASENNKNLRKNRTYRGVPTTSKYKGVCHRTRNSWSATINVDGVQHRLGHFPTEEEAARAYDEAAKRLHGAFGRTNEDVYDKYPDPFFLIGRKMGRTIHE